MTGCVHDLVAEWAARTPDAVAVETGSDRISYGELDTRANQVADLLRQYGVEPRTTVGLCMRRGVDWVVCLLGILKAGAVADPLDPGGAASSDTAVVLGRSISVDLSWLRASPLSTAAPSVEVSPDDLAYVGRSHRAVLDQVRDAGDSDQVFLLISDTSAFEVWGALTNGARLAVLSQRIPTTADVESAVRAHGVTVLPLRESVDSEELSPLEEAVVRVWREVLGIEDIGPGDDFFDLGGHSLLATQVVALLQEKFPVDIPVSLLFEAPTVELLANELHRAITDHVAALSDSEVDAMMS